MADTGSRGVSANFRRASALAGGLICLLMILAMLSRPAGERRPLPLSLGAETDVVRPARAFHFTAENVLGLFVIGLVSSTFGGMLGMGGGVMKMSCLLLFFGLHTGISRFAALLSYFGVALGASRRYVKLGFVMGDVVRVLIPTSVLGIVIGAVVGHRLPREGVTILLGMFLMFISVAMARRILSRNQDVAPSGGALAADPVGWKVALCGFPGGLLSAMLGISGGVVTTPLQQVLARIPIKNAVANTLTKASVTVPIACLMILVMGLRAGHYDFWTPVLVSLCLIPGSVIGSQLGPALTRRMSSVAMYALLGAVALFMGVNLLFFGE
jgi:uncharacterized membrane protein YfcA